MPLLNPRPLSRLLIRRTFASIPSRNTSWSPSPSPPRLPKEEQEIFERLQRQSTGAFSTPQDTSTSSPSEKPDLSSLRAKINQSPDATASSQGASTTEQFTIQAQVKGEELHPHVRRGARPEFEGDTNPKTGEVGGPKNEPLRWGAGGDWSYNGRVTDF